MNEKKINDMICNPNLTIIDAMELIDKNARGLLFVVDKEQKLIGCISDGDIRRSIIKSWDLNTLVGNAMKCPPLFLHRQEIGMTECFMEEHCITAVPIIDENMHIVDIVFRNDYQCKIKRKNKQLDNVPVIIMAGGEGTRLYPYTKILPKPLIPIGQTPIVERIINCFCEYGIRKFYMVINYKKEMIKSYFHDINPKYEVVFIEESKPLGTCGGISLIKEEIDRPVFVTNSDTLILTDYEKAYDFHLKSKNDITIISALKNIIVPYGVLCVDNKGKFCAIDEKPRFSHFINTGMYIINHSILNKIPYNSFFHMTNLIQKVSNEGGTIGSYPISEDSFLDMGEFGEMRRMEEKLHIIND